MKTLVFALFLLCSLSLSAQVQIYRNLSYEPASKDKVADTLLTYNLVADDYETVVAKFKRKFGQPDEDYTGQIIWRNKTVEGLSGPVDIFIFDGIITANKVTAKYVYFKSADDRKKRLAVLKKNQSRKFDVAFAGPDGKSVVNEIWEDTVIEELLKKMLN
jgi:hypothetical protein